MSKVSFIYFDIGGVFLDWQQAFMGAAKSFNLKIRDMVTVFDSHSLEMTTGKMTPRELWEIMRSELNINGGEDFNFLKSWVDDYVPVKSTYDLAKKISGEYGLGIISNIYKGMYPLLEDRGILPKNTFNSIILSCEVGLKKPDLAIYELAQEKAGTNPSEILFVDDTPGSLIIHAKLGWQTFQYDPLNYEKSSQNLAHLLDRLL